MNHRASRRHFLGGTLSVAGMAPMHFSSQLLTACSNWKSVPVRTLTKGPKFHWFGYYDKLEFDPSNRYVLSNQVDFEGRTPHESDRIGIGMVDLNENDRWIELGVSRSWGWQQGCMLQWVPGTQLDVVWNDREGDRFVSRVMNVMSRSIRTLPHPIYTLSPNGKFALTADFARIQRMRPGYGYVGLEDPCRDQRAPENSGVWRMDMDSGKAELIFSLADAARIPHEGKPLTEKWNYFNHLLINPSGTRFVVLHRWRENATVGERHEPTGPFTTRMFTVGVDGRDRYLLDPSGHTSHFIWRDDRNLCAWTKPNGKPAAFYLLEDQSEQLRVVGEGIMIENGHNTYVPETDNEWILNDTYPDPVRREQRPYLYHVPSRRKIELGRFHSPPRYSGEWRCDTHPRCSRDGQSVVIDSPHADSGRQLHLIDIRDFVS